MAFAEVVSRLASDEEDQRRRVSGSDGSMRQCHRRRASGITASSTSAARPDRKLATCQPVRLAALKTAPPVEKSSAAATSRSRLRTGDSKNHGSTPVRRKAIAAWGPSSFFTRSLRASISRSIARRCAEILRWRASDGRRPLMEFGKQLRLYHLGSHIQRPSMYQELGSLLDLVQVTGEPYCIHD